MKKKINLLFCCLFSAFYSSVFSQEYIFSDNEKLVYTGAYSLGFIYTEVAQATFQLEKLPNRTGEFRVIGTGQTYKFYDKIHKVRDHYESQFYAPTFASQFFSRDINEGGYTLKNAYYFDWTQKKLTGSMETKKGGVKQYETEIDDKKNCSDVLTSFYRFRSIDFSNAQEGQKYITTVVLDNEIFSVQCIFRKQEKRKPKTLGKEVNCLKFSLETVKGNTFKGDETISIWVSDDKNHIPVELEFPLSVGKMRAYLQSYENVKYPINFVSK